MSEIERVRSIEAAVRGEVAKAVVGQERVVDAMLVGLITGGHILLEGVPGTAKTLIARAVARAVDASFKRIQFSPDLMPADVVGTNVFDAKRQEFTLRTGPVFANIVLADEINRTPPKTQASLLEAMQERRVTIDGTTHALPAPFLVVATQNPVEYEGTYPLPEAQLDRFLMKVTVTYPSADDEHAILARHLGGAQGVDLETLGVTPVVGRAELLAARDALDGVVVDDGVIGYVAAIVRATREDPVVALGASPRAGVSLLVAAKAYALLDGRAFVTPDDVKGAAPACLRHRITLQPEAEIEGATADSALDDVLAAVPVPR